MVTSVQTRLTRSQGLFDARSHRATRQSLRVAGLRLLWPLRWLIWGHRRQPKQRAMPDKAASLCHKEQHARTAFRIPIKRVDDAVLMAIAGVVFSWDVMKAVVERVLESLIPQAVGSDVAELDPRSPFFRAHVPADRPRMPLPDMKPADVTVAYLRESGTKIVKALTVPATRQCNIDVKMMVPELIDSSFGARIHVTNDAPIAVVRSMYRNGSGALVRRYRCTRHADPMAHRSKSDSLPFSGVAAC